MTTAQRITKIQEFVQMQRYLEGLSFRVVEDPDIDDAFVIEFEKASQRQLLTLAHRLRINDMMHIRVRALEVISFQKSKHKGK